MKERRQDLKEFAEQYYWNHVTRFHFVTVMLPGFDHQMVFPEKFVKNSKEDFSENVILKGPSGNLWLVKLLKVQGDLLFKEGWKEFVEAHNIEEGDTLSFEYEGYSCFNVLIYDAKTGCEREASYFAKNHKNIIADAAFLAKKENGKGCEQNMDEPSPADNHENEPSPADNHENSPRVQCDDRPQVEQPSLPNFTSSKRSADKSDGRCDDHRRKIRKSERLVRTMDSEETMHKHQSKSSTVSSVDDLQAHRFSPKKFCTSTRKTASKLSTNGEDVSTSRRKKARPRQIVQENTEQRPLYEVHLVSNRRPVTDEEKDRALRHASELKPDNPFFRIVMRDTHVYKHHFMTIPVDFVAEHLPSDYQAADLRIANGKTTYHDVRLEQQDASVGLSGQLWRNFVQANNLEEGDACVFELYNADRVLLFDVHIFRVLEEVAPLDKQSVKVREANF